MRRAPWWMAVVLASCGGADEREARDEEPAEEAPVPEPTPAPRQLREVRRLVIDLAAQHACDGLENRMMTIHGEEEGSPHVGRIWLRGCRTHARRDRLDLDLEATAWIHVNESTESGGATFQVRQYVFLSATTTLRTVPELDYDRARHYGYLWLRPIEDPRVRTRSIGPVDADPEGAWSHVLGVFARVIGQRPDDHARAEVDEQGDQRFEQQVDQGFTIFSDLCTGDVGMEMGRLSEPPYPRRAPGEPGQRTPVIVYRGGLDVHGPISGGRGEMIVRMESTEGGPARGRLLCQREATRLMSAFTSGQAMPDVRAIDDERIPRGEARELRGGRREACPLYVVTTPTGDGPSTVAFTVRPARDVPEPLVAGCGREPRAPVAQSEAPRARRGS